MARTDSKARLGEYERIARLRSQRLAGALLAFMRSADTGAVLFWLIHEAGRLQESSMVPGDPHATSFNEGRRAFAIEIANKLQAVDPGAYLEMQAGEMRIRAEELRLKKAADERVRATEGESDDR